MRRTFIPLLISVAGGIASVEIVDALQLQGLAGYGVLLGCIAVLGMPAVIISAGGFGPRRPELRRSARRAAANTRR